MQKIMKFFSERKFLVVVLLVIVAVIGGSRIVAARANKKAKTAKVVMVERKNLEKRISISGAVDASEKVNLRFQTSGKLAWVGVKEGERVKKWQAIASLDTRDLKKNLEKEMADYLKTRWDWEQGREDYNYNQRYFELSDSVKRILEKNQFDLNKAVLDVELADLAVKYATIATPIEGVVTKASAPLAGINVTPATAEFEVINPASVYFLAEAEETDVSWLKEGQRAEIILDAFPGSSFEGLVSQISFNPINTTGSPNYGVKIAFDGSKKSVSELRMRMEGEALVEIASVSGALVIPSTALQGNKETTVNILLPDGKNESRRIVLGLQNDDEAEVLSGLSEGEKIIVD